ncbi:helix-turn-helix domain-containing protein [Rhodoblastus sp.]|uniref:helix-turn-helix domain-containing protein n=1 Tax=Rhodoblastus sp. TaxID=1962975 RepID=UPI0026378F87|nr:helix-turn-helix domain-containing protein [Rhodoblastus sp.]
MFVFEHRLKKRWDLSAEEGWHRADIIAAVRKRGTTLAALGRKTGLSPKSMHWALGKRHPRANLAIAAFLGVDPHEIWPRFFPPTDAPSGGQTSAGASSCLSSDHKAA